MKSEFKAFLCIFGYAMALHFLTVAAVVAVIHYAQ